MPDREKIESGVHHCGELHICKGCPYRGYENCTTQLFGDLMAYIRELEERTGKDDGSE